MHSSGIVSGDSSASRVSHGIPIYAPYQSPSKSQPRSGSLAALSSTRYAPTVQTQPPTVVNHIASPSRSTQEAFLRQKSPRPTSSSSSSGNVYSSSSQFDSLPLPSMHVASLLDDDQGDDADDEATDRDRGERERHTRHALPPPSANQFQQHKTYDPQRYASNQFHPTGVQSSRSIQPSSTNVAPSRTTVAPSRSPSESPASSPGGSPSLSPSPSPTSIDADMLPAVHAFLRSMVSSTGSSSSSFQPTQCELTPQTVPALHALQSHLRLSTERADLLDAELQDATKEYQSESTRMQGMLNRIGMNAQTLSPSIQPILHSLTSLAQLLALKNTKHSSFLAGLLGVTEQSNQAAVQLDTVQGKLEKSKREISQQKRLHSELRALTKHADSRVKEDMAELDQRRKQVPYFQTKAKEYERDVKEMDHRLHSSGYSPHLSHESLVSLSEQIGGLEEKIVPLEKQLETYMKLPPDITLARIRVAEAHQHLAALEDEFSRDIRQMQEGEY